LLFETVKKLFLDVFKKVKIKEEVMLKKTFTDSEKRE